MQQMIIINFVLVMVPKYYIIWVCYLFSTIDSSRATPVAMVISLKQAFVFKNVNLNITSKFQ